MVRKLFLVIIIMLITACGEEPVGKNDLKREGLKGKVKMIKERRFTAVEDKGRIQREKEYDFNIPVIYRFDKKGNFIEKQESFFFKQKPLKYDSKGNVEEVDIYDITDSLVQRWIYKYDEQENEIEKTVYNIEGDPEEKYVTEYDDKGLKLRKSVFYLSESASLLAASQLTKVLKRSKGEEEPKTLIGLHLNYDGSSEEEYFYKYDENEHIVEEIKYAFSGKTVRRYEYKLDEKKNWIEKVVYLNEDPDFIVERTIEYY